MLLDSLFLVISYTLLKRPLKTGAPNLPLVMRCGRVSIWIQSLTGESRYSDIAQAANEFERDIQNALAAIESLSQTDPDRAAGLNIETSSILRGYGETLTRLLTEIPEDVRPVIQNAIDASQVVVDNDNNDSNDDISPTPTSTLRATPDIPVSTPTLIPTVITGPRPDGGGGVDGDNDDDGIDGDNDDDGIGGDDDDDN